jgi:hypothetical protein
VHQGFLKQPVEEAIKLPFGHEGGVEGMVHVGPDPNIAKYEALNTRAWVFQETILARRLLIYSQKGATWSCISDHIQSNCFEPHTMNVLVEQISASWGAFGHPDLRGTYGFIDRVPKKDEIESVLDLLHTWHHLVEEYTPLKLTFLTIGSQLWRESQESSNPWSTIDMLLVYGLTTWIVNSRGQDTREEFSDLKRFSVRVRSIARLNTKHPVGHGLL